ncbi:unnamed protein product [Larinioides sclopetarius]|uniref:Fibrinogen C-terminal domain-containing protein n=1 Tax=Larinioides sclopetarius TaxID=280406 RepID=A0AAV2C1E9_9ARAC
MKTFLLLSAFLFLIITDISAAVVKSNTTEPKAPKAGDCSKCPKHEKPMDCAELQENGVKKSGVYTIYPRSRLATCQSIEVYCDMETDGGGWTEIRLAITMDGHFTPQISLTNPETTNLQDREAGGEMARGRAA